MTCAGTRPASVGSRRDLRQSGRRARG
jgi:hypothetical protein